MSKPTTLADQRNAALEAFWQAFNHPDMIRIGYHPSVHQASQRLRELEAVDASR
jgi:GTPase